jgi:hypothetical protein
LALPSRLVLMALLGLMLLGGGCKSDKPGTNTSSKDMTLAGDGGGTASCAATKCDNPDSVCCGDEPCIDLKTNPINCGSCGKSCRAREVCSTGKCACRTGGRDEVCTSDALCCTDGCRQVKSDVLNCGGCNLACKMGESCSDGQCRCGPAGLACRSGQVCCGSGCTDMQNDPNNCGSCGRACPMGKSCKNGLCDGECPAPCTFPEVCCAGSCSNILSDPLNCRACGRDCNKVTGIGICIIGICVGEQPPDGGTPDM